MNDTLSLWGLFLSAFVSSTLFPGGSELVLGVIASQSAHSAGLLVAVATAGNTLGGMSSWAVGRVIAWRYPAEEMKHGAHRAAVERMRRWGSPALLLSWLPVIGDPLCIAAGWLKVRWWWALVLIALGKLARYAVLVWLVR